MKKKLPIFSAFGVELEYMIVNRNDLSVQPISDKLIYDVTGEFQGDVEFDAIAWSNELVLHVIELKTNGPANDLSPLAKHFQDEVQKINSLLGKYDAKLLPTGAHPWMDPHVDAKLWPHDNNIIYDTYHKIFDCRGHGWSNLQSVHLNLPFANDAEFAKLHTAIRLVLPLLPALSASTPVIDGKLTGILDTRLEYYRLNQQKIPSVTGEVIPELVFSEEDYNEKILNKMYRDISSYDPDKTLQEEWLNSRGAIARFERNTIEIRVIDTQECPQADLAIICFIVAVLKHLVSENWQPFSKQAEWDTTLLSNIFLATLKDGMKTAIPEEYAKAFGLHQTSSTARDLFRHLLKEINDDAIDANSKQVLEWIIQHGNLAERIVSALARDTQRTNIEMVYQKLAHCLQAGEMFVA